MGACDIDARRIAGEAHGPAHAIIAQAPAHIEEFSTRGAHVHELECDVQVIVPVVEIEMAVQVEVSAVGHDFALVNGGRIGIAPERQGGFLRECQRVAGGEVAHELGAGLLALEDVEFPARGFIAGDHLLEKAAGVVIIAAIGCLTEPCNALAIRGGVQIRVLHCRLGAQVKEAEGLGIHRIRDLVEGLLRAVVIFVIAVKSGEAGLEIGFRNLAFPMGDVFSDDGLGGTFDFWPVVNVEPARTCRDVERFEIFPGDGGIKTAACRGFCALGERAVGVPRSQAY